MEHLECSGDEKERHTGRKMTTKELARSMGLVSKPLLELSEPSNKCTTRQLFTYVIVVDFEATCWREKKLNYAPEIIEFPAVLLNTATGSIESEFHMFVQPSKNPRLSGFCTELTGITQAQVDDGVPIGTCLLMFARWLQKLKQERGIWFYCEHNQSKENLGAAAKWCTFVTWSDWDFGVCLKNECIRKQLRSPQPLRSWIDLRATYKNFYSRKPQGLAGALQDVGITFSGRQHSGLDDARNTAKLAWRMVQDGCVLRETKALDGPARTMQSATRTDQAVISRRNTMHNKRDNVNVVKTIPLNTQKQKSDRGGKNLKDGTAGDKRCQKVPEPGTEMKSGGRMAEACASKLRDGTLTVLKRKLAPVDGSLISPKVSVLDSRASLDDVGSASLVTPVTCLSRVRNVVGYGRNSITDGEWLGDRMPSVLSLKTGLVKQTVENVKEPIIGPSISGHVTSNEKDGMNIVSNVRNLMPDACKSDHTCRTKMSHDLVEKIYQRSTQEASCISGMNLLSTSVPMKLMAETPLTSRGPMNYHAGNKQTSSLTTPKHDFSSTFTVKYGMSRSFSKVGQLGAVSALSSHTMKNQGTPLGILSGQNRKPSSSSCFSGGKATPPLCHCGRRSRKRAAVNPGPNQGRVFYTCPQNYRQLSYGAENRLQKQKKSGCNFFQWDS